MNEKWGAERAGGGAAARNAPARLAPGPRASRFVSARVSAGPAARPALGRGPSLPRGLSWLRVVTKHYKKAGRAVPGTAGGGAGAEYILTSAPPPRLRLGLSAPPPPPPPRDSGPHAARPQPAARSPRHGPHPSPARPTRRCAGSQADARAQPEGRTHEGGLRCGLHRRQHLGAARATAGRRLTSGTVGGSAPRPETSVWDQVGRRGAEWRGRPWLVPGAFPVSPPFPGSFPAGRGRGRRQSGWESEIPGSRNAPAGALGLLASSPRAPSPPSASGFFLGPDRTERRPERPGPFPASHPATLPEPQLPRPSATRGLPGCRHPPAGRGLGGRRGVPGSERGGPGEDLQGSGCPAARGGAGTGAGRARWRVPGTHAALSFLPAAPRDAVAAAVRRPPSSCSRRRADPRWLRAPWSPTASFPPPG